MFRKLIGKFFKFRILEDAGVQIRLDTLDLINVYRPYSLYCNNLSLLENRIPLSYVIMTAPSYAKLEAYLVKPLNWDALGYDLESWEQTPLPERQDPVKYYQMAAKLAHDNGKQFVGVPGLGYMEKHPKLYAGMSKVCDRWIILAQGLQAAYPQSFRAEIIERIARVREGNLTCPIWVQLSVTPGDLVLTAQEVLEFRDTIKDLVAGVTIFDVSDPLKPQTLTAILRQWRKQCLEV